MTGSITLGNHSDILIMGAGPAGLSLALAAARHGLSVR
ncbi:FAD-binding protein, partial [Erythrobacter donghaensis]